MNVMHERSCLILELSLALTGATHLPPTDKVYLCNPRSGLQSSFHPRKPSDFSKKGMDLVILDLEEGKVCQRHLVNEEFIETSNSDMKSIKTCEYWDKICE